MPHRAQRPLSAYNLFFKVQRYLLINDKPDLKTTEEVHLICNEIHQLTAKKPDRNKRKRLHRKTHGKIGFSDLGKIIGQRWRNCNSDIKACFEEFAREEKNRYYKSMKNSKERGQKLIKSAWYREKRNQVPSESEDMKEAEDSCRNIEIPGSKDRVEFTVSVTSHPCKLDNQDEMDIEPLPYKAGQTATSTQNEIESEAIDFFVSVFGSSSNPS